MFRALGISWCCGGWFTWSSMLPGWPRSFRTSRSTDLGFGFLQGGLRLVSAVWAQVLLQKLGSKCAQARETGPTTHTPTTTVVFGTVVSVAEATPLKVPCNDTPN